MKGQAYINDKDVFTTWKVSFLHGFFEALLKPAPMKEYIGNASRLEHGKRYVANESTSRTDERTISLTLFIEGDSQAQYLTNVESFFSEMEKGGFTLKVPKLNKVYHFVYSECSQYGDFGLRRGKFVLKLTEPNTKDRQAIS